MGKAKLKEEKVDLLGQLTIELGGTEFLLRPDRLALSAIEQQTGHSLVHLASRASALALTLSECGICIAELMHAVARHDDSASADYKGAKAETCADLVLEGGQMVANRRLTLIFTGAITGGYTAKGEVKAATETTG